MNWRLKLSNWLSGGAIERYRQQAETAKAKWQRLELDLDSLRNQLKQSEKELAQTQGQLQIYQGFQIELGETQIQLRQTKEELATTQKQLAQSQQKLQQSQTELTASGDWLGQIQTEAEVVEVEKLYPKDFEALWGFGLSSPVPKTKITGGSLYIKGWVLGKRAKATKIKICWQQQTLVETLIDQPRQFAKKNYPEVKAAANCGFETMLTVAGMPTTAQLEIQAVLADDSTIPILVIHLKR